MRHYCTYFDSKFLSTGLTLYRSLEEQCPQFKLWVLCLDEKCHEALSRAAFPHIEAIAVTELENADIALAKTRENRSLIEYYFTCTASYTLYLLNRNSEIDLITYLDADLYFFSDPAPIFDELEGYSIGIIGHRFPERMRKLERYGIYNVGWVTFRKDASGIACLESWRKLCIDWCYDRLESERFADQKYLDEWPQRFSGVRVVQHKGANLAPWNLSRYKVGYKGNTLRVDEQDLIFFHFHGIKQVWNLPLYNTSLGYNRAVLTSVLRHRVYRRYLVSRESTRQRLLERGIEIAPPIGARKFVNALWGSKSVRSMSKIVTVMYSLIICRAYIFFR